MSAQKVSVVTIRAYAEDGVGETIYKRILARSLFDAGSYSFRYIGPFVHISTHISVDSHIQTQMLLSENIALSESEPNNPITYNSRENALKAGEKLLMMLSV